MSKDKGQTIWRCDRCGRKVELPGEQTPIGWATVERRPMGAQPEATDEWDLCDGCGTMVQRLLQPVNSPDNSVKRMVGSGPPLTEVELVKGYQGDK